MYGQRSPSVLVTTAKKSGRGGGTHQPCSKVVGRAAPTARGRVAPTSPTSLASPNVVLMSEDLARLPFTREDARKCPPLPSDSGNPHPQPSVRIPSPLHEWLSLVQRVATALAAAAPFNGRAGGAVECHHGGAGVTSAPDRWPRSPPQGGVPRGAGVPTLTVSPAVDGCTLSCFVVSRD